MSDICKDHGLPFSFPVLLKVNTIINKSIRWKQDKSNEWTNYNDLYGIANNAVNLTQSYRPTQVFGDCDDYVTTKLIALHLMGVETFQRCRSDRIDIKGIQHEILRLHLDPMKWLILDNRVDAIVQGHFKTS